MTSIDVAIAMMTVAILAATWRMLKGPTDADRAVAADLVLFGMVGLVAMAGVRAWSEFAFDILLIASLVAFLSAVSLARALTRGKR